MRHPLPRFAEAVAALESTRHDEEAVAALEREIAASSWLTPAEREAAQTLILRLALLTPMPGGERRRCA